MPAIHRRRTFKCRSTRWTAQNCVDDPVADFVDPEWEGTRLANLFAVAPLLQCWILDVQRSMFGRMPSAVSPFAVTPNPCRALPLRVSAGSSRQPFRRHCPLAVSRRATTSNQQPKTSNQKPTSPSILAHRPRIETIDAKPKVPSIVIIRPTNPPKQGLIRSGRVCNHPSSTLSAERMSGLFYRDAPLGKFGKIYSA